MASARVKEGATDHHRRRIDAAAQHEFADGVVHARRNSVIVGAKPDAARARRLSLRRRIRRGFRRLLTANSSMAALTGAGSKMSSVVAVWIRLVRIGFAIPVLSSPARRRSVVIVFVARYSAASLRSLSAVFRFCSATK